MKSSEAQMRVLINVMVVIICMLLQWSNKNTLRYIEG
ncbi:hypothetical protein AZ045_004458 [Enterobacter hormaechei]|nr:hypothetical protein AZ045_004458 [Enterobacter hormaechei]